MKMNKTSAMGVQRRKTKNKHLNKEDWEVVINCMVNNMAQIIKNRFKLSFFNDDDLAEEFDDILDGIDYKISKFDTIYKKIKNNEGLTDINNKFFDVRPNLNQIPTLDDDIEEEYEDDLEDDYDDLDADFEDEE